METVQPTSHLLSVVFVVTASYVKPWVLAATSSTPACVSHILCITTTAHASADWLSTQGDREHGTIIMWLLDEPRAWASVEAKDAGSRPCIDLDPASEKVYH